MTYRGRSDGGERIWRAAAGTTRLSDWLGVACVAALVACAAPRQHHGTIAVNQSGLCGRLAAAGYTDVDASPRDDRRSCVPEHRVPEQRQPNAEDLPSSNADHR